MKQLWRVFNRSYQKTWVLRVIAAVSMAGVMMVACGKLSDDSDRPYTPTGSSSGQQLPVALPDELGAYKLTLIAEDDEIPADGVTFTVLQAKLFDSSGASVENFIIKFNTTPESDAIGLFLNPATTVGSGTPATTTTGRTHSGGSVSVRFYGVLSGSCVVQASVDIDDDGTDDLYKTLVMSLTPAGPPNSAGSYRLLLTADPDEIPGDAGTASVITAQLVDSSGGSVQNFTIKLEDTTKFGGFGGGEEGGSTGTVGSTTYEGTTDVDGKVVVPYYGNTPGVALIRATVKVNDLVGELNNTVKVTVFEVIIPNPSITLESPGNSAIAYECPTTLNCPGWGNPRTLDAIFLVKDGNGERVGGATLAYSIVNTSGCGAVVFSTRFGTATTDVFGRAEVDITVTGSGSDSSPSTCTYDLEVMYNKKLYLFYAGAPSAGVITVN